MSVTIRIIKGESYTKPHDLLFDNKTIILIGRGNSQDVNLENDSVSRRHAVLEQRDGVWTISDEGTINGTILNGTPVHDRTQVHHGDVVEIGEVMLIIGLDKILSDDVLSTSQKEINLPYTIRIIQILFVIIGLSVCGIVSYYLLEVKSFTKVMTSEIPINLNQEVPLDVLDLADRTQLTFSVPGREWPGKTNSGGAKWYTVPEWYQGNVWDGIMDGRKPRLFDGLDLSLNGGNLVCMSSYFYATKPYFAHDANDPYGRLDFDLEGWGGVGPRNGQEQIPALRMKELPHYLLSVDLYPENIKPYSKSKFEGGEIGKFSYTKRLDPNYGHPLVIPKNRKLLAGKILPELVPKTVAFEGRYYSFYHNGSRYTATVRGSQNLLNRFPGGIDALADAFFASIKFPNDENKQKRTFDRADLEKQAQEKLVFISNFNPKLRVIDRLLYEDLLKIRNLIIELQAMPEGLEIENELRRSYFELRDKAQAELELASMFAYESREKRKAPEAIKELRLMRRFLGRYPLATSKPGQHGYPEWGIFFQQVIKKGPFKKI